VSGTEGVVLVRDDEEGAEVGGEEAVEGVPELDVDAEAEAAGRAGAVGGCEVGCMVTRA
jgi:hypothetical protein